MMAVDMPVWLLGRLAERDYEPADVAEYRVVDEGTTFPRVEVKLKQKVENIEVEITVPR